MKTYLVAFTIGPVQSFISAARRSHDLFYGSRVLSALINAAAESLRTAGAVLIYPSAVDTERLPLDAPNVLLASVRASDGREVNAILADAKTDAVDAWQTECKDCLATLSGGSDGDTSRNFSELIRTALFNEQRDNVFEYYWAWQVLVNVAEYGTARKRLMDSLASRKNTRDFMPANAYQPGATGGAMSVGLPKSSLDGARETVLVNPNDKATDNQLFAEFRQRFRLLDGEQLDCPGLVKRVLGRLDVKAGEGERFTSLSRIALEPYIRRITEIAKISPPVATAFADLSAAYAKLESDDLAYRSATHFNAFSWDGQLLFPERLQNEISIQQTETAKALPREQTRRQSVVTRLQALAKVASDLANALDRAISDHAESPSPVPYVAVLLADGDSMGKLLSTAKTQAEHSEISMALSKFAQSVTRIVHGHGGQRVYAGGDDVLAFLPVDTALDCASELAKSFHTCLTACIAGAPPPTLSVGIAIGHVFRPMGELRTLAQRAEQLAKEAPSDDNEVVAGEPRNGLGLIIAPRSGAPLHWRGQLLEANRVAPHDDMRRLMARIANFAHGDLSMRAPYQLRELCREFAWSNESYLRLEANRLFARKQQSDTNALQAEKTTRIATLNSDITHWAYDMRFLATEWLIARWFAAHMQALAPPPRAEDHLSREHQQSQEQSA